MIKLDNVTLDEAEVDLVRTGVYFWGSEFKLNAKYSKDTDVLFVMGDRVAFYGLDTLNNTVKLGIMLSVFSDYGKDWDRLQMFFRKFPRVAERIARLRSTKSKQERA